MFDEMRGLFRRHIDRLFFGDNEIQSVSEKSLRFDDPEYTELEVVVKDINRNNKMFRIIEIK